MDVGRQTARRLQELRLGRGWSYEELARRSSLAVEAVRDFEITCAGATLRELSALADALETTTGSLVPLGHPLEAEWHTTAWDVLSATERGFRAKVCVVGKLAEWKLFEQIQELTQLHGELRSVEWNDADDRPDFQMSWRGSPVTVECKNVRRYADKPSRLRVELQKTRNSKDGSNTRSYPRDKFDVLAACLYNQTREWRFVYCATKHLAGRQGSPQLLAIYHDVPSPPSFPWTTKLPQALDEASR